MLSKLKQSILITSGLLCSIITPLTAHAYHTFPSSYGCVYPGDVVSVAPQGSLYLAPNEIELSRHDYDGSYIGQHDPWSNYNNGNICRQEIHCDDDTYLRVDFTHEWLYYGDPENDIDSDFETAVEDAINDAYTGYYINDISSGKVPKKGYATDTGSWIDVTTDTGDWRTGLLKMAQGKFQHKIVKLDKDGKETTETKTVEDNVSPASYTAPEGWKTTSANDQKQQYLVFSGDVALKDLGRCPGSYDIYYDGKTHSFACNKCPKREHCEYTANCTSSGWSLGSVCMGHNWTNPWMYMDSERGYHKCGWHYATYCSICGGTHECQVEHCLHVVLSKYPTCEETGVAYARCCMCNENVRELPIPKLNHYHSEDDLNGAGKYNDTRAYVWTVAYATCTTPEYASVECMRDNSQHRDAYSGITVEGYPIGSYSNVTNYYWKCCTTTADKHYSDRNTVGKKLGHTSLPFAYQTKYNTWINRDNPGETRANDNNAHDDNVIQKIDENTGQPGWARNFVQTSTVNWSGGGSGELCNLTLLTNADGGRLVPDDNMPDPESYTGNGEIDCTRLGTACAGTGCADHFVMTTTTAVYGFLDKDSNFVSGIFYANTGGVRGAAGTKVVRFACKNSTVNGNDHAYANGVDSNGNITTATRQVINHLNSSFSQECGGYGHCCDGAPQYYYKAVDTYDAGGLGINSNALLPYQSGHNGPYSTGTIDWDFSEGCPDNPMYGAEAHKRKGGISCDAVTRQYYYLFYPVGAEIVYHPNHNEEPRWIVNQNQADYNDKLNIYYYNQPVRLWSGNGGRNEEDDRTRVSVSTGADWRAIWWPYENVSGDATVDSRNNEAAFQRHGYLQTGWALKSTFNNPDAAFDEYNYVATNKQYTNIQTLVYGLSKNFDGHTYDLSTSGVKNPEIQTIDYYAVWKPIEYDIAYSKSGNESDFQLFDPSNIYNTTGNRTKKDNLEMTHHVYGTPAPLTEDHYIYWDYDVKKTTNRDKSTRLDGSYDKQQNNVINPFDRYANRLLTSAENQGTNALGLWHNGYKWENYYDDDMCCTEYKGSALNPNTVFYPKQKVDKLSHTLREVVTLKSRWDPNQWYLTRHTRHEFIHEWVDRKLNVGPTTGNVKQDTRGKQVNGDATYFAGSTAPSILEVTQSLSYDDKIKLNYTRYVTTKKGASATNDETIVATRVGYYPFGWNVPWQETKEVKNGTTLLQPYFYAGKYDNDGDEASYAFDAEVNQLTPTDWANVHMYLLWEPIRYNVHYTGEPLYTAEDGSAHVARENTRKSIDYKYLYPNAATHSTIVANYDTKIHNKAFALSEIGPKTNAQMNQETSGLYFDKSYNLSPLHHTHRIWARGYRFSHWLDTAVNYEEARKSLNPESVADIISPQLNLSNVNKLSNARITDISTAAGWNGVTKNYPFYDQQTFFNLSATNNHTILMHAVWNPIRYRLIYDMNEQNSWRHVGSEWERITDSKVLAEVDPKYGVTKGWPNRIGNTPGVDTNRQFTDITKSYTTSNSIALDNGGDWLNTYSYTDVFAAWPNGVVKRDGYKLLGWAWKPDAKTPDIAIGQEGLTALTWRGDDNNDNNHNIKWRENTVVLYAIWEMYDYHVDYDQGYTPGGQWVPAYNDWAKAQKSDSDPLYKYLLYVEGDVHSQDHLAFEKYYQMRPITAIGGVQRGYTNVKGYTFVGWKFDGQNVQRQHATLCTTSAANGSELPPHEAAIPTGLAAGTVYPAGTQYRGLRAMNGEEQIGAHPTYVPKPANGNLDDDDIKLHAVWKEHEYEVHFHFNDQKLGTTDISTNDGRGIVKLYPEELIKTNVKYYEWLDPPVPTREGWDFIGWQRATYEPNQTDTNSFDADWFKPNPKDLTGKDWREEFTGRTQFGRGENIRALTVNDITEKGRVENDTVIHLYAIWVRHRYYVHYLPGVGSSYLQPSVYKDLYRANDETTEGVTLETMTNPKFSDDHFYADLFRAYIGADDDIEKKMHDWRVGDSTTKPTTGYSTAYATSSNYSPVKFQDKQGLCYFDKKDDKSDVKYNVMPSSYKAVGYTFIEWIGLTDYKNDTVKKWPVGTEFRNLAYTPPLRYDYATGSGKITNGSGRTEDVDMIATWKEHTYTIHFDTAEERGTTPVTPPTIPDITNIKFSEWVTLPDSPTRDGYEFIGWTTDKRAKIPTFEEDTDKTAYYQTFNPDPIGTPNESEPGRDYRDDFRLRKDFEPKEEVRAMTAEDGGEVTLYAVWKPIHYFVAYDVYENEDNDTGVILKERLIQNTNQAWYYKDGYYTWNNPDKAAKPNQTSQGHDFEEDTYGYTDDLFKPYTGGYCETTEHIFDVWKPLRTNKNDVLLSDTAKYDKATVDANNVNNTANNGFVWLGWTGIKNYTDDTKVGYDNSERVRNLSKTQGETIHVTAVWRPIRYNLYVNWGYQTPYPKGYTPKHALVLQIIGNQNGYFNRDEDKHTSTSAPMPVPGGYQKPWLNLPFNEFVTLPTHNKEFHMQGYNMTFLNTHHEANKDAKRGNWVEPLELSNMNTPAVNTKSETEPDFWSYWFFDSVCDNRDVAHPGYTPGTNVRALTYQDGDTIVLEARWEAIKYKLFYHPNLDEKDPTGDSDPKKWPENGDELTYDELTEPKEPGPTGSTDKPPFEDLKPGYHIDYWSTEPDGGGRKFTVHDYEEPDTTDIEEYLSNLTNISNGNVHLYAHWAPNTYYVVIHDNYNGSDNTTWTKVMTYDKEWTLPTEETLAKLPAESSEARFRKYIDKATTNADGSMSWGSNVWDANYMVKQDPVSFVHTDLRHLFLGYNHSDTSNNLCREAIPYATPDYSHLYITSANKPEYSTCPSYARPFNWRGGVEKLKNLTTERFAYVHVNIIWDIAPSITYGGKDAAGNPSSLEEHLLQSDIATWDVGVENGTISKSQLEDWLLNRVRTYDFEWKLRCGDELIHKGIYSIPNWTDGQYELKVVSLDPVKIKNEAENPTNPSNTYYVTFSITDDVGQTDTCTITLYIGSDVDILVN